MRKVLVTLLLAFGILAFAQEDVAITWMTGNRSDDVDIATGFAEAYMANNPHTIGGTDYNVNIEVLAGPESATDRLGLYLQFFEAQSAEVDLFEIDVIWPGDLAVHLVDLNQFDGVQEAAAEHFTAIVENNTVEGALVGLPYFTDAGLLYSRSDLLEEYGFDGPPQTWSELEEMATTIQEGERADNQDFSGFVWQGNAYEGLTCDALEWVDSFGGGQIVSPDGVITINNEQAVQALETAAGWVGTISPQGVTGFQEEDARNLFQNGNAAFMRNWPYAYSLAQGEDSAVAGNVTISTLPAADGQEPAATLGGWQLGVSQYSANPAVAADFALFVVSPENQLTNAIDNSKLPTVESVYQDQALLDSDVAWFSELLPVFQNAVARPSTIAAPQYGETSRIFFTAVHDVLTGQEDAATALELASLDLSDLLGLETGDPQ